MRTTIAIIALILVAASMFVSGDPALNRGMSTSLPPDQQTLTGNLGPDTEVTITYSATQSPATVQIGQKKFIGYRNQSVIYFSEFIKGKTDAGYEVELSPDFRADGDSFVYSVPGTATSVACSSPDSLILTVFRNGRRASSACIESERGKAPKSKL